MFRNLLLGLMLILSGFGYAGDKPKDKTVRLAVIGDFGGDAQGNGKTEGQVANLVKSWNPDFVVTVGDNNYPDGQADTIDQNIGKYYSDFIGNYHGKYKPRNLARENRFFPALGNHDWDCTGCEEAHKAFPHNDYFDLPGNKRYYDYKKGNVQIFILDSDTRFSDSDGPDSVQGKWLKSALAKSTAKYKLVFFHNAAYSSNKDHGSEKRMKWPFAKWGATAVLAGHDHFYERLEASGIPYFVSGNGGNGLYPDFHALPESKFVDVNNFGAILITASDSKIIFEAQSVSGKVLDRIER